MRKVRPLGVLFSGGQPGHKRPAAEPGKYLEYERIDGAPHHGQLYVDGKGDYPGYAGEVSAEEYLAYTTEETEKVEVYRLAEQLGGDIEAAIRQLAERRRNKE